MIKFFRKIRYDLMKQNKTGKYFKYAIGEIVLVVIGILLALQINNWNENRTNNNKLKSYLTEIIKDLKTDTLSIRIDLNFAKRRMETTKSFLELKDYDALTIDSLEKSLETFYSKIPFSNSAFEKIESSGITDFGEYESLIEKYKVYYNIVIPDIMSFEGTHNRAVDIEDNYWRYNQNVYEFSYDDDLHAYQSKEVSKKNLITLLQSPTARNILKIDYRRNKRTFERLNILNDLIIKLIKDTEAKLND
jgi:hypothetical protein